MVKSLKLFSVSWGILSILGQHACCLSAELPFPEEKPQGDGELWFSLPEVRLGLNGEVGQGDKPLL